MDKQNMYVHKVKYYSAIKRNEALIHATAFNLENITLNERSQNRRGYIFYDSISMTCPE